MIHLKEFRENVEWLLAKLDSRNGVMLLLIFCIFWQYFQINTLNKKVAELYTIKEKNIELEKKYNALSSEVIIFKASTDIFPFPYWIKDLNGKIIYVNDAFLNKYLRPRGFTYSDYVGHYDYSMFSPDESEQFRRNDSTVLSLKKPLNFIEKVGNNSIKVVKFEYRLNGVVVGVAGVEYEHF